MNPEMSLPSPQSTFVPNPTQWQPVIKRIMPVVRWAILAKHDPRLTELHTEEVGEVFKKAWPTWKEKYRASVEAKADRPSGDLQFDDREAVRLKKDGKTPMLDLPRLRTVTDEDIFDLRCCAALCIDEYSSKFWSRLGPPIESETTWQVGELRQVVARYRALGRSCCEWFYEEFRRLTADVLEGITSTRGGMLEVTTVGLQVEESDSSDDRFDSWLLRRDEEGREGPNLENEVLSGYLRSAAGIDFHPRHLRDLEPDSYWMALPSAIELPNGDLASRKVLYMVRPIGGVLQIVGIGLDDSESGYLAGEVARKISRFVANRV